MRRYDCGGHPLRGSGRGRLVTRDVERALGEHDLLGGYPLIARPDSRVAHGKMSPYGKPKVLTRAVLQASDTNLIWPAFGK